MTRCIIVAAMALAAVVFTTTSGAQQLEFGFKNPSFHSGNGYSSHVLSVEQLRFTRQKEEKAEAEAKAKELERESSQNTVKKFLVNVESRIYAQLSKQLVDNMFGTTCDSETTTCPTSGTADVEGSTLYWVKDTTTGNITLTITDTTGAVTTMTVPVGDFVF